ncbi:hypothetical protein LZ480_02035 [Solibacillus sp. MA9]|uniref:DUF8042 domain-containing protein n=1 Tax=Solibacillus palustris TaxID=2908203 RepID=A0ABS9U8K2_9BACL|nr:hypothetical protein [Solibacillus sp. MA9]MCH7320654.1 hypothetical protein [Solibacillus sp. MA9]
MQQLLIETQQSYYEYVVKIQSASQKIANLLKRYELEQAFRLIADLSEGINWIVTVEQHIQENNYIINSRTSEVIEHLHYLNELIERKDIDTLSQFFEHKFAPLFASSSEWIFKKVQN